MTDYLLACEVSALRRQLFRAELSLARIERLLLTLTREEMKMSTWIEDLAAQVEANTNAETSAITLIQGLVTQLENVQAAGDLSKLPAITQALKSSGDALAAAILANTPAGPVTTPAPAAAATTAAPVTTSDPAAGATTAGPAGTTTGTAASDVEAGGQAAAPGFTPAPGANQQ